MAKITNTAAGPRGVLLADGTTHYVEPGQTVDLDVAKGHALYDGLTGGEGGPSEPGPLDQSVEKLTAYLDTIDDVAAIDDLIAAETAGKSRAGALTALDARKEALAAA